MVHGYVVSTSSFGLEPMESISDCGEQSRLREHILAPGGLETGWTGPRSYANAQEDNANLGYTTLWMFCSTANLGAT